MTNFVDGIQNRRRSWDGVIVRYLGPEPEWHGKLYRVDTSWYDSGNWRINYDPRGPIDPDTLPRRTRIYNDDGTTWDLKQDWRTAFPKGWFALALLITFVLDPLWAQWGMTPPGTIYWPAYFVVFGMTWIMFANFWFFAREPVRGSRLNLAMLAAHEAYQYATREQRARDAAMVPQWPKDKPWVPKWEQQQAVQPAAAVMPKPEVRMDNYGRFIRTADGQKLYVKGPWGS